MTSGQDVSEYLDILGLVKSYFSIFLKKIKKIENFFLWCSADAQRMRRLACSQDFLLTLTCHLACGPNGGLPVFLWVGVIFT
jgi:hypothetical protein